MNEISVISAEIGGIKMRTNVIYNEECLLYEEVENETL